MKKLYFLIMFLSSIAICQAQRPPVAMNDVAAMGQSRTILINVLANDSNFNSPDSVCLTSVWGGYTGWATVQNCTQVLFHPLVSSFVGKDTFYYRACDVQQPSLCDTGRVIVTLTYLPPHHVNDTVTVIAGDTARANVLANDTNFNPQDQIRLTAIFGGTTGWSWIQDSTQVVFHAPDSLYYGLQRIRYRACDTYVTGLCDTGTLVVNVIRTPKAYNDSAILVEPAMALLSVVQNDSIFNGIDSACITQVWGQYSNWATVVGCNQVSFLPASYNFFGQDTLYYRSCYTHTPSLCDTGMIVLSVVLPKPQIDFIYTVSSPCEVQAVCTTALTDSVVWSVVFLTHNGTDFTIRDTNAISIVASMDSDFEVTACLTGMNAGGDTTVCYTFWIQCHLNAGINTVALNDLEVFPNPTTGRLTIKTSMPQAMHYILSDLAGRYMLSGETVGEETDISMANLAPGIYQLQIGGQDKRTYKVVKE